jgi:hypothetical protein
MPETLEKPKLKPLNIRGRERYPLASKTMVPVQDFCIGGRWLSLYFVAGRPRSAGYSLYWDDTRKPTGWVLDDARPLQHAMTDQEVFIVLAQLLEKVEDERIDRLMDFKFEQR